jgi:hypothetical protein
MSNIMEHIGHRSTGSHSIDSDLFLPSVLGHDSYKGINGAFGTGVNGVVGDTKVLRRVRGREDDTTAFIEVTICLTGDEELTPGVKIEHTVEFLL